MKFQQENKRFRVALVIHQNECVRSSHFGSHSCISKLFARSLTTRNCQCPTKTRALRVPPAGSFNLCMQRAPARRFCLRNFYFWGIAESAAHTGSRFLVKPWNQLWTTSAAYSCLPNKGPPYQLLNSSKPPTFIRTLRVNFLQRKLSKRLWRKQFDQIVLPLFTLLVHLSFRTIDAWLMNIGRFLVVLSYDAIKWKEVACLAGLKFSRKANEPAKVGWLALCNHMMFLWRISSNTIWQSSNDLCKREDDLCPDSLRGRLIFPDLSYRATRQEIS